MCMRTLVAAAAIAAVVQQPAFRSRVDLIRLDVTVVDKDGRPVRDLTVEDFVVTIDGTPRRVSFAQFIGPGEGPRPAASDAPVSVATNTSSPAGRVIVLVADLESIRPGSEKLIMDAAADLVGRLGPSDAVGLLVLPGRSIELTRDHGQVREALLGLRGFASPPPGGRTMSIREAESFRINDRRIIAEVIERECRPSDSMCPVELQQQVMPLLVEADRRAQSLVTTLTALFGRLERVEAPKSVVLLSAGLQRRQSSAGFFNDLQRRADTAGVAMTIVQIEQSDADAGRRTAGGNLSRADLADGLSAIAGATSANMFFGVARAAGAFERIRNEIIHSYQLGVESAPSDADGRKRRINVDVRRSGVTVRARKELVVPSEPRRVLNPVDLLSQPVDFAEAPLTVATYMTRGEERSTLKMVVLVETDPATVERGSASYAFSLSREGKTVFETAEKLAPGVQRTAIAAQIEPGRYRLRAAIVDAAGRQGSLEMPIVVGLRQAASLQFSDLIVGSAGESFTPVVRAPGGTPLSALLEIYSAEPAELDALAVTMEVRRPGDAATAIRVVAPVRKTSLDRRRAASADLPALNAGTWLISAVVRRGETVAGQVSRTIVVASSPAGAQLEGD